MQPLWTPPDGHVTHLNRFRQKINHRYNLNLQSYDDLWQWSVKQSSTFWTELWYELEIVASKLPTSFNAYDTALRIDDMPEFFAGSLLNYAENTFTGRFADDLACICIREGSRDARLVTWGQLKEDVRRLQSALKRAGVVKGDRVAAIVSNTYDPMVIMLASVAIGALYTSTAPDMGASGILDRLVQVNPKIVFMDPVVVYKGKLHDISDKVYQVSNGLRKSGCDAPIFLTSANVKAKFSTMEGFIAHNSRAEDPLTYEQVNFAHPGFILYSSGTSGVPKCIVHSHGGALIQIRKEACLHYDLSPGDILFQYTTTSWVMWNYVAGSLSSGITVILYDGSPLYPDPTVLLHVIKKYKSVYNRNWH